MKFDKYRITITFTESCLGTAPKQEDIYKTWFQDKQRQAAEKAGVELSEEMLEGEANRMQFVEEKGLTGFHRTPDGQPALYDYMVRGYLKTAIRALRKAGDNPVADDKDLRAFKKVVDTLVFVKPRLIPLELPDGLDGELSILERPLQADTPQGERVSIARSEMVPRGTRTTFQVWVLGVLTEEQLHEIFDYGSVHGISQWRSGGWGTFEYAMEKI